MKKSTIVIAAAGLALGLSALSVSQVFAFQGKQGVKGPNYSPDRHKAMLEAFESQDYEAWLDLINGRGRVTQVINADNFPKFAQAHLLASEGKLVEAQQIREKLGLKGHQGRNYLNQAGVGPRAGRFSHQNQGIAN